MKFFKKLFWLTVLGAAAWWGWKFYDRIRATFKLGASLPLFLKNTVGEKPAVQQNLTFNSLILTLRFDPETIEREENLEQMVREYVEDFYPVLAGMDVRIKIEPRAESSVVEPTVEAAGESVADTAEEAPEADGDE